MSLLKQLHEKHFELRYTGFTFRLESPTTAEIVNEHDYKKHVTEPIAAEDAKGDKKAKKLPVKLTLIP
jgi:hypothetical protein